MRRRPRRGPIGLTADAGDDDGLKFELAEGYRRLGLVQGVALEGSVGDTASARISLEKAARLAEDALAARTPTVDRLALTMRAQYDLATLLVRRGEPASADRPVARLLAVVEALTRRFPTIPTHERRRPKGIGIWAPGERARRTIALARSNSMKSPCA